MLKLKKKSFTEQCEGQCPFPRGDNNTTASGNTFTKFKNPFLQNHWAIFNQTWHKASLGDDSRFYKQGPFNPEKRDNVFILLLINVTI